MTDKPQKESSFRPPIVAVLGHVDHGKTTLLDTIRKSNVASREHGGITQHIGAYQVKIKDQLITFIDTPGHEAFAKMRSRGAHVADIALLVVAADDSVKPQTKESIEQIKASGASMIVVVNKIDLPTALVDKVKADLAKNGVQVEGFGGDVPVALVSAKQGTGVSELLDLILLVYQMKDHSGDPLKATPFEAIVIETRIDHGRGMVATVVVKKGTLQAGMPLFEGTFQVAKVRAMFDEYGNPPAGGVAPPSKPVEVLGFTKLPAVGSLIQSQAAAPTPSNTAEVKSPVPAIAEIPDWLKPVAEQEGKKLIIILKADTAGSIEAITASFSDKIRIISSAIGDISDADVLMAKSTGAFIVGFNVKCPVAVAKLAETEKVIFRTYHIIYELLDELSDVVSGMKEVLTRERELGTGTVIAEFPFEKQRIAGTQVASGRLAKGDTVKIMREDVEIARAKIKSVRLGKEDVTKVEAGNQCGVLFDKKVDFLLQDAIIAITTG
ncbi:MAG: Translation initiation factor IF-2 [Candidatus Gottesmanbacteria bacterium GW2011_GWA2_47_9]|uniref:Translation initiation factor IF-2 n=3 Tax=Candidatus Gottesmaniibacteriota TaxID=1752720 RepID=A0A0G1UNX8_9BACT|nr:MAG: Translation initiation factor IF-2 [Candidatus Gottesmanbacteria bacterium GW2011_GWA2_47_9]KKU95844.1 MAG: Translation initiation factor IF-2 [Candidatus Gottesmanbacteria bacterium GW2011_GWA1_48_13]